MKRIQFLLELVLECAKHWTALLLSWALSTCDARLLCTLSNSLHLLPYSALRTGDQGHGLATSFPNEWSFFFSLFCLYEDGGVLLLRELSVSLWRGLPPYNGIKFKFKCGRDVKSTVGKKIGGLQEHWGRLVVAFHNYRITRTVVESVDIASRWHARARARTHTHTHSHIHAHKHTAPDRPAHCMSLSALAQIIPLQYCMHYNVCGEFKKGKRVADSFL